MVFRLYLIVFDDIRALEVHKTTESRLTHFTMGNPYRMGCILVATQKFGFEVIPALLGTICGHRDRLSGAYERSVRPEVTPQVWKCVIELRTWRKEVFFGLLRPFDRCKCGIEAGFDQFWPVLEIRVFYDAEYATDLVWKPSKPLRSFPNELKMTDLSLKMIVNAA